MAHYGVEAKAARGTASWVALSFAAQAGVMAPAVAVVGGVWGSNPNRECGARLRQRLVEYGVRVMAFSPLQMLSFLVATTIST